MFTVTRLRLTLGYLSLLAIIVGLLSLAVYNIAPHIPDVAVQLARPARPARPASAVPSTAPALAARIALVDLGALALGALGAYLLAGYALCPVREGLERQRRFAAAASHELRTPLTVLMGTLEAAQLRRRTPEQYEDVLHRATAEAEYLSVLIDEILILAHVESGADTALTGPLDLRAVARAATAEARPLAEGKGQTLTAALYEPLPVRGNAAALGRAVAGLLDNAVNYTPAGGTIDVVARHVRGRAVLTVRDTGPGIAPEHLPHLFEPFYRVDPARMNGDIRHAGLGLSRAARIARAHRGQLSCESVVGVGSVFTLSLPLDRAPESALSKRAPADRASSG